MNDDYNIARQKVNRKKRFYSHLSAYITMGIFFFILNVLTSYGDWWFYFPMLSWGIGLLIHYFTIFGIPGVVNYEDGWEERAIQEELQKMNRSKPTVEAAKTAEQNMELKALQKEPSIDKKWDDSQFV